VIFSFVLVFFHLLFFRYFVFLPFRFFPLIFLYPFPYHSFDYLSFIYIIRDQRHQNHSEEAIHREEDYGIVARGSGGVDPGPASALGEGGSGPVA